MATQTRYIVGLPQPPDVGQVPHPPYPTIGNIPPKMRFGQTPGWIPPAATSPIPPSIETGGGGGDDGDGCGCCLGCGCLLFVLAICCVFCFFCGYYFS